VAGGGWVAGAAVAGAWVAGAWVAAGVLQAESSMEAKINRLARDQITDFLFISLSPSNLEYGFDMRDRFF
jgi:hypothetical protein